MKSIAPSLVTSCWLYRFWILAWVVSLLAAGLGTNYSRNETLQNVREYDYKIIYEALRSIPEDMSTTVRVAHAASLGLRTRYGNTLFPIAIIHDGVCLSNESGPSGTICALSSAIAKSCGPATQCESGPELRHIHYEGRSYWVRSIGNSGTILIGDSDYKGTTLNLLLNIKWHAIPYKSWPVFSLVTLLFVAGIFLHRAQKRRFEKKIAQLTREQGESEDHAEDLRQQLDEARIAVQEARSKKEQNDYDVLRAKSKLNDHEEETRQKLQNLSVALKTAEDERDAAASDKDKSEAVIAKLNERVVHAKDEREHAIAAFDIERKVLQESLAEAERLGTQVVADLDRLKDENAALKSQTQAAEERAQRDRERVIKAEADRDDRKKKLGEITGRMNRLKALWTVNAKWPTRLEIELQEISKKKPSTVFTSTIAFVSCEQHLKDLAIDHGISLTAYNKLKNRTEDKSYKRLVDEVANKIESENLKVLKEFHDWRNEWFHGAKKPTKDQAEKLAKYLEELGIDARI